MNRNLKRLLTVAGAAAAGYAAVRLVSFVTAKNLVDLAMDRNPPAAGELERIKSRFDVPDGQGELWERLARARNELETAPHETVEIHGPDGEKLVGHWFPCEDSKRVIVAMHGWRSSWASDFGVISGFWRGDGCSVLYAEQRGQNGSGGDYMGFGITERYDCLEWVKWVNGRCGADTPVYLAGVSMGATTVLLAAGSELPGNVRGVIADCGFTSAGEIWKHVVEKNLRLAYGPIGALANEICRRKINVGADECSTLDAMKACRVPVLFIHGEADRLVPVEMTLANYEACSAPKRLLTVPGADHGTSYVVDEDGYKAVMREFWAEYDAAPGAGSPIA